MPETIRYLAEVLFALGNEEELTEKDLSNLDKLSKGIDVFGDYKE